MLFKFIILLVSYKDVVVKDGTSLFNNALGGLFEVFIS